MGQLSAQCPHCRVKMQLHKPELIGKTAKCPSCKEPFVIEPLQEQPAKPAAASAATAKKSTAAAASAGPKPAATGARKSPTTSAAAKAKAKAKPDIDFEVDEDEEILEAEVVEDDHDWLKGLDSLSPTEMGKRSARTSGAAPVVRGLPKKQAATTKKRKRRVRDADGELPLWMSRSLTVLIGATVGGVAMLVWAGFTAKTGLPSRWMPVFIGATVGTGVRLGASKWDFGLFPAITAALIALTAVIGGKVIGVNLMKRHAVEREAMIARYELRMVKHEDYKYHLMAEEIHDLYIEDGLQDAQHLYVEMADLGIMSEPEIADLYNPNQLPEVYGETRWKEAQDRWKALSEERKAEVQEQIAWRTEYLTDRINTDVDSEVVERDKYGGGGALSIIDFIAAGIAVVGAFKIAAGMADSAIDTSEAG